MKLAKAWVNLYRNIVNSGELSVEDSVTCLVGKNESGKTAFLKALYSLNPHNTNLVELNTTKNFPRWLKREYERKGNLGDIFPITALFYLEEKDIDILNDKLKICIPKNSKLYIKRSYDNQTKAKLKAPESEWIDSVWNSNIADKDIKSDISKLDTVDELLLRLKELKQKEEKEVSEKNAESNVENEEELSEDIELEEDTNDNLEKLEILIETAEKILEIREYCSEETFITSIMEILPTFFYYSHYSSLNGQIDLDDIFEKIEQKKEKMDIEDETAIGLLKLAGITPDNIPPTDFEELIAELEASAIDITKQILEYWTQNDKLRVNFYIEPKIRTEHPTGKTIDYKCLNIRLNDLRHHMTTNFSTRSSGFQWFFSFIIAFSDFENRDDVIILLDEPGLGLHALAQNDLLRFIEEKLGNGRQVIYTNHSPFLINPKKLENVRLVEDLTSDENPNIGSKISEDVLSVEKDTRFPLQAALGYSMAQNLFIGGYTLIVEGPSDLLYLKKLSEYLKQKEMTSLDSKITIAPVGGADKIPTFIALLGAHIDVTVLVDANMNKDSRLDDMVNQDILDENRLIDISKITGDQSSNIEDLFTDDEYLKLYNASFNTNIKPEDIAGEGSIIKRIETKIGHKFNHYSPSWELQKNSNYLNDLSDDTLKNFEKLLKTLNETFK